MRQVYHETPLGTCLITETDGHISRIHILDGHPPQIEQQASSLISAAVQQFDEYFAGTRQMFDFPIKQSGSAFQQSVWEELLKINYGETISYGQMAGRMNNPLAIRAMASANGKNNLWIAVPCHRVVGANGSLTGYAGGLWRKQWLLEHEAKVAGIGQTCLSF